jgi:hypothetical protein
MRRLITCCAVLTLLLAGGGPPEALAAKMYWTDDGTDKIQRASLDGTGVQNLVTGLGDPRFIALDLSADVSVPEPASLLLLASSIAGLVLRRNSGQALRRRLS